MSPLTLAQEIVRLALLLGEARRHLIMDHANVAPHESHKRQALVSVAEAIELLSTLEQPTGGEL